MSEKENANDNEESFANGDVAKGDFILVNQEVTEAFIIT